MNKKILFITTTEILGPSNDGGVLGSNKYIFFLKQAFGEENIFICIITKNKEYLNKENNNIKVLYQRRNVINILNNILSKRLMFGKIIEDKLLEYINNSKFNIIFFGRSLNGLLPERIPKNIKQILFLENIEKDYAKKQVYKKPLWFFLIPFFKYNEMLSVKNANFIIALNKRDADKLQLYYKRNADCIIPVTLNDNFKENKDKNNISNQSKLQLLFVGTLFPPNEHGVTWFVKQVMPYVNAEFTIVGKNFEKLSKKLNKKNVNVVGTVDDLSIYYNKADAIISPILFGEGMKVKTAEALMYGKTIFATDEALEGYDVEGVKNIFRCNTEKEFITSINNYAENPPYISVNNNIRELFLDKYHTPKYVQVIKDLVK